MHAIRWSTPVAPRRSPKGLSIASLVILAVAAPSPSAAFKGKEHESVANDGLQLALARAVERGRLTKADKEPLAASLIHLYGQRVAEVDYVLNPIELLEQYGLTRCLPGVEQLVDRPKGSFWAKRLNHLRAAHNNEIHFGAEALNSFWTWHAAAVDSAARGGCAVDSSASPADSTLFGVVLANAVSESHPSAPIKKNS